MIVVDTHVHVAGARDLGGTGGLGLQMVAAAGATTVIDLGGTMEALAAGVAARGSGVNVGSLGYLRPGETVPEGRLNASQIRDVEVVTFDGLAVECARLHGCDALLRGVRNASDFEAEHQMALTNRRLDGGVDALFLSPRLEYSYISSRLIKEIAALGGPLDDFLPETAARMTRERMEKKTHG